MEVSYGSWREDYGATLTLADHFSMMAPPFSEAVGAIVVDTVARAVAEIGL
jgi:hypothetical protein